MLDAVLLDRTSALAYLYVSARLAEKLPMANVPKKLLHYKTLSQADVPRGRSGKHKKIVVHILNELDRLEIGTALKIPFGELGNTKENIRSAVNRASRKAHRTVATAADGEFLYLWNTS